MDSKTKQLIVNVIVLVLLIIVAILVLPVSLRLAPANATQAEIFDHSNCQYPDRWSNPADGCDNSDPAVPECIKAAFTKESEDACIAAFVAQHEQPAPVIQPITAPTVAPECGGK